MKGPLGKRNVQMSIVVAVIIVVVALLAIAVLPNRGSPTTLYTAPASQLIVNSNDMGAGWRGGYVDSIRPEYGIFTLFNISTSSDNAWVEFSKQISNYSIDLKYYMFKFNTTDEAKAVYEQYYSEFSSIETLNDPGLGDKSWNYSPSANPSLGDRFFFVKGNVVVDVWVSVYTQEEYTQGSTSFIPLTESQIKGYALMQEAKIL